MSIKESIENYKKILVDANNLIKNVHNKTITISPNEIRVSYEKIITSIEIKRNEFKAAIEMTNENIKSLEECKIQLKEINQEIDNFIIDINNKKIGTLHGNVRQIIEKNPYLEMDEIHKIVINQLYNE